MGCGGLARIAAQRIQPASGAPQAGAGDAVTGPPRTGAQRYSGRIATPDPRCRSSGCETGGRKRGRDQAGRSRWRRRRRSVPRSCWRSAETLIEIWRPHRQHHHARRPETRTHKRHFERREATPVGCDTARLETTVQRRVPNGTGGRRTTGSRRGRAKGGACGSATFRAPASKIGRRKAASGGKRTAAALRGQRGRKQAGDQNRGGAASVGKEVLGAGRRSSPSTAARTRTRRLRSCFRSRRGWRKKTTRTGKADCFQCFSERALRQKLVGPGG